MSAPSCSDVAACLRSLRAAPSSEDELQATAAAHLAAAGHAVVREAPLSAADRVDLLVGSIGIEVKVEGSPTAVAAQLDRYAQAESIEGLVLLTTRARHRTLPLSFRGKPCQVVYLSPLQ